MPQEMITLIVYKYITELDLLDLENKTVIPCLNEEGYRSLLIKNSKKNTNQTSYTTKFLLIKKNTVLIHNDTEYYFHIITCREKSEYMDNNFTIIFEYLFEKLYSPISDDEFTELINSIQELFKQSTESLNMLQVGTAGELITLLYLYENGMDDVLNKYHKNSYSKHDIELDSLNKIEVKTTTKDNRIHRFSHDQLSNNTLNIYVASIKLSTIENGLSLYDLFIKILGRVSNSEVKFGLRKIMNYCGVDIFNKGIQFNFLQTYNSVKLIKAKDIPQIESELPAGVSNIVYDSICDLSPEISVSNLLRLINM